MDRRSRKKVALRFFLFFIIGLILGIIEDLIAIHYATDAVITWHIVKVASLVAFPFAVLTELVVDLHLFRSLLKKKLDGIGK